MCFMAGANAVFTGEQMLTTPCSPWDEVRRLGKFVLSNSDYLLQDKAMMGRWGLAGMQSFEQVNVARKEGFSRSSEEVEAVVATA
jgi:biotin synthase